MKGEAFREWLEERHWNGKPLFSISDVASAVRNYRQSREAPVASDWPALDELQAAFPDRVPGFVAFPRTDKAHERIERHYKDAVIAKHVGSPHRTMTTMTTMTPDGASTAR